MSNKAPGNKPTQPARGVRRMPQQSLLYDRIVPIALIGMGVFLVIIVVVALGFLLGLIRW
ncbi:MAG: hypothetical protein EYC68_09015 [Chloroflexota bacterium]|nr:MAG: hypothetical protein EYC68_09015 [Chloroflexota bacterium]